MKDRQANCRKTLPPLRRPCRITKILSLIEAGSKGVLEVMMPISTMNDCKNDLIKSISSASRFKYLTKKLLAVKRTPLIIARNHPRIQSRFLVGASGRRTGPKEVAMMSSPSSFKILTEFVRIRDIFLC